MSPDLTFFLKISGLGLPMSIVNVLESVKIKCIGDLIQFTETELSTTVPDLKREWLDEIKNELWNRGLVLGTKLRGWPPKDLDKRLV